MRNWLAAGVVIAALLIGTSSALAADTAGLTCSKTGMITKGGFIKDMCWSCFFPITIGGMPTSAGPLPGNTSTGVCVCPGKFGYPTPGITLGMWQPTHTISSPRQAFCFPELDMQISSTGLNRASMGGSHSGAGSSGYRHFHLMKFPVDVIMDMFGEAVCNSGSSGMDIMFISEIDPTHNNEALAAITAPESFLFNNPVAMAACLADAVATTISKPIRALTWCMGSWSQKYPMAGFRNVTRSAPQNAITGMAKGVALTHRRGLLNKTYGLGAVCKNMPTLDMPKQQYRFQPMYPLPSRKANEWLGRTTFVNREFRHLPGVGEDFVDLLWTFEECCANY